MEKIIRKGIAFEVETLKKFDALIRKKGYMNRSEAIRDLIRKDLIAKEAEDPDACMIATLTIVYSHHMNDVQEELTHLQHHHPGLVRSSLHIHIDQENCLEVIILEGKVRDIRQLADGITAAKGVRYGKLVIASTT